MVDIPDFRTKWERYKLKAHRISPHFVALTSAGDITQDEVARRLPRDSGAPPFADDNGKANTITGSAFGQWLVGRIPDDRVEQWTSLTRLPIEVWAADASGFDRALRRAAGEVLGWAGLVQAHSTNGVIRIRVEDRQIKNRFERPDEVPDDPADLQLVWPECIARIEVPIQQEGIESRRCWLLCEYTDRVVLLDPPPTKNGSGISSRLASGQWRATRGGHVMLPRGTPDHVWITPGVRLGTRFDVYVLLTNLGNQPDEIQNLFEAIEHDAFVKAQVFPVEHRLPATRKALDDVASLIDAHDIPYRLFRRKCEVVGRDEALGRSRD